MKTYLIFTACLSLLTLATANAEQNNTRSPLSQSTKESCKSMSGSAEALMSARQRGVAMSVLMDGMIEAPPEIKWAQTIAEEQIKEAYDSPRYFTEDMKKRAIEDFRDKWYLNCIKSFDR